MDIEERFWAKVDRGPGCWTWIGAHDRVKGYGSFWTGSRRQKAHRASWELHHGPIPAGFHVLHSCDNPPCVNPAHLWLGTNLDNVRDRDQKGRHAGARQTHCVRGHPLTPGNVRVRGNTRRCLACEHELYERRPQRRVVERFAERERLECGHDIYGETNAVRRRCRECAEGEQ